VAWGALQLVYNLYLRELGFDEGAMGVFAAAQTLAMAVTGVLLGAAFNRAGIWRCVFASMALFAVAAVGLAFAESLPVALAIGVVSGIGVSAPFTGTMPFIVEAVEPERRQFASTVAYALVGMSFTLGSLVGGLLPPLLALPPLLEYRWTLVAAAGFAVVALVPLALMSRERRTAVRPDRVSDESPLGGAERAQARADGAVFVTISLLIAAGFGAFLPFFNVYLAALGAPSPLIGLIFAAGAAAQALAGLAAQPIIRRFGTLWTTAGLRLAPLPLFALMLAMPTVAVATLASVARAAFYGPTLPAEATFVADILPPAARSHVFGLRFAAWNLGWAGASVAAGWAISRSGYAPALVAFIVLMVCANVLNLVYFRRHPHVASGQVAGVMPPRFAAGREAAS